MVLRIPLTSYIVKVYIFVRFMVGRYMVITILILQRPNKAIMENFYFRLKIVTFILYREIKCTNTRKYEDFITLFIKLSPCLTPVFMSSLRCDAEPISLPISP